MNVCKEISNESLCYVLCVSNECEIVFKPLANCYLHIMMSKSSHVEKACMVE